MSFITPVVEGNFMAAQFEAQAAQARDNARTTRLQNSASEDRQRRQMAMDLGVQRAAAAQSGFVSNTGSMLTLQGETRGEMELDVLTSRYEGELKSISLENEARRHRSSASAARVSGYLKAAEKLASGASMSYGR